MADVTISDLGAITPATGLLLPASNGTTTGSVTLSQVCGVMTAAQITTALGYTPYNSTNPAGYITASSLPASQQLAKAWVTFRTNLDVNESSSTANTARFLKASYNVGSVVKNSAGVFTVNFSPSLATSNYNLQVTAGYATDNINTAGQGQYCIAVAAHKLTNAHQSCQVGTWDDTTGVFGSDYNGGNTVVNVAIFHN